MRTHTEKLLLDRVNKLEDNEPMGRTVSITFRCLPHEKKQIKAAARFNQQAMAFYIRDIVMGDLRTIEPGAVGRESIRRRIDTLILLLQMKDHEAR